MEIFRAGHRDPPIGGRFFSTPLVFFVLGGIFAAILDLDTDQIGPEIVYFIAYVWLSIALGVRRLHDIGRKGTWLLLGLVPFGNLVLLYWLVQPSSVETNEWEIRERKVKLRQPGVTPNQNRRNKQATSFGD